MSGRDHLRAVQRESEPSPSRRKSQLPSDPPERDAAQREIAAWLTVALGLGGDPIVSATRYGRHLEARMVLTVRSGQRVTFERQADIFDARKLSHTIIAATGAEITYYGPADAQKVATAMVRLSDLLVEDDDRAEAVDWASSFLARSARNVLDVSDFGTPAGRWEAFCALDRFTPPETLPAWATPAERAPVVRDVTGRRLVCVADMAAHVRAESGRPLSWPSLHSRLVEAGWQHLGQVQQRQPGGQGKVKKRVYLVPAGWEQS